MSRAALYPSQLIESPEACSSPSSCLSWGEKTVARRPVFLLVAFRIRSFVSASIYEVLSPQERLGSLRPQPDRLYVFFILFTGLLLKSAVFKEGPAGENRL